MAWILYDPHSGQHLESYHVHGTLRPTWTPDADRALRFGLEQHAEAMRLRALLGLPRLTPDGEARRGTLRATRAELEAILGVPEPVDDADEKVTIRWSVTTPFGRAVVRDYWWNAPDEWSIGCVTDPAAHWIEKTIGEAIQARREGRSA